MAWYNRFFGRKESLTIWDKRILMAISVLLGIFFTAKDGLFYMLVGGLFMFFFSGSMLFRRHDNNGGDNGSDDDSPKPDDGGETRPRSITRFPRHWRQHGRTKPRAKSA